MEKTTILYLLLILLAVILYAQYLSFRQWEYRRREKMIKMHDFFKEEMKEALGPYVFFAPEVTIPIEYKNWQLTENEKLKESIVRNNELDRVRNKIIPALKSIRDKLPYLEVQEKCKSMHVKKEDREFTNGLKEALKLKYPKIADCILEKIEKIGESEDDWIDRKRLRHFVIPLVMLWQLALQAYFYDYSYLIRTGDKVGSFPKPTDVLRVIVSKDGFTKDLKDPNTYAIQVMRNDYFKPVTVQSYENIAKKYGLQISRKEVVDAVRRLNNGNKPDGFTMINYEELAWFLLIVYEHAVSIGKPEKWKDLGSNAVTSHIEYTSENPSQK